MFIPLFFLFSFFHRFWPYWIVWSSTTVGSCEISYAIRYKVLRGENLRLKIWWWGIHPIINRTVHGWCQIPGYVIFIYLLISFFLHGYSQFFNADVYAINLTLELEVITEQPQSWWAYILLSCRRRIQIRLNLKWWKEDGSYWSSSIIIWW